MSKRLSTEVAAELTDFPVLVGQMIQETFFPYPPTNWNTMSPEQRQEFIDCGQLILSALAFGGWDPRKEGPTP